VLQQPGFILGKGRRVAGWAQMFRSRGHLKSSSYWRRWRNRLSLRMGYSTMSRHPLSRCGGVEGRPI
jgi:hypothetical protein